MLRLATPSLADHLFEDGGVVHARDLAVRDEALPPRFSASLLEEGPEGPPWNMIITGLETGRLEMRSRFESALATANARQRARMSTALSACYSGMFGFRRDGPGRTGFEAWAAALPIAPDRERAARDAGSSSNSLTELEPRQGCRFVTFSPETGHVPVGHDLLLYFLAEAQPALVDVRFDEVADFDPDVDRPEPAPSPYTLHAWLAGRRYEAAAHAHGDHYDVLSAIGFLNSIMGRLGRGDRYHLLGVDSELVAHGPPEFLLALEDDRPKGA
ncbi:MAG: hypothetical protein JRH11_05165 [Deltaproteobacteria bacterium]|nr:hypothetical protein [Deltaproteobacteria bacterium]